MFNKWSRHRANLCKRKLSIVKKINVHTTAQLQGPCGKPFLGIAQWVFGDTGSFLSCPIELDRQLVGRHSPWHYWPEDHSTPKEVLGGIKLKLKALNQPASPGIAPSSPTGWRRTQQEHILRHKQMLKNNSFLWSFSTFCHVTITNFTWLYRDHHVWSTQSS